MTQETIICCICLTKYEYEEDEGKVVDGITYRSAEALPDGYFSPGGEWFCDDCGSCPTCGTSLEKEADKRAHMVKGVLYPAQPCDACVDEKCEFSGRGY